MQDVKKIREAIIKNRGGHEQTDDSGILTIWNSLDAATQEKYLKSIETLTTESPRKKEIK
jgi:hypothetical protein